MHPRKSFKLASVALLFVHSITASQLYASEQTDSDDVVLVSTVEELLAALVPANAGHHIRVRRGDYAIDLPLTVPDGAILEGEGIMRMENGLPIGFEPDTTTTIRVAAAFEGDLLTLGNGSALRGLRFEDLETEPGSTPQRSGNVIVVGSRAAGDRVSAVISDCEIVNPNRPGVGVDGPTGHPFVVLTRNLAQVQAPPPHVGATVSARLERSVVRAGGSALFAINFAAAGTVDVALHGNRLEGTLGAAGGASRPDEVSGASVTVESRDNLYAPYPGGFDGFGWRAIGGSSPHLDNAGAPGTNHNLVRIKSTNDRIEGFKVGILAIGGRRWLGASDLVSDNRVELELNGTRIQTEGEDAADLSLQGAFSEEAPEIGREFPAGNRNVVRVLMRGVTGSSPPHPSSYTDVFGPALHANRGTGNRLEFTGSLQEFMESNPGFSTPPPAEFFREADAPPR